MLESSYSSVSPSRWRELHDNLAGGLKEGIQNRMTPANSSGVGMDALGYPCPVRGYLVFDGPPGSYAICPICFWEDDIVQLGFPLMDGGANRLSLHQSQQEFMRTGACEFRLKGHVRPAVDSDKRDPAWRLFDPASDPYLRWGSPEDSERWAAAEPGACLYYWRREYWLLSKGAVEPF